VRKRERERERERERDKYFIVQNDHFFKGMIGALAPFSYLVFK
jgi:hypothetical protein